MMWVDVCGDDTNGDGTVLHPFKTIAHAVSEITDSSYTKRYIVYIGPGEYVEDIKLPAWVFLRGCNPNTSRINGNLTIDHASWTLSGPMNDTRGGVDGVLFGGLVTIDFSIRDSRYGKFYIANCWCNNVVAITGCSAQNQLHIDDGMFFDGFNITGVNCTFNGTSTQGGTVSVIARADYPTLLSAMRGSLQSNFIMSMVSGDVAPMAQLIGCPVTGNLTLTGLVQLFVTVDSLPQRSQVSLSGGATITCMSDACALAYVPSNVTQWQTLPITVQEALDRISNIVYELNGNTPM